MGTIFHAQWLQLKRNPVAVLIMTGLSILFILFIGGQAFEQVPVAVLPAEEMSEEQTETWLTQLDRSDRFAFRVADEDRTLSELAASETGLAVRLWPEEWRVLAASGDTNAGLLAAHVGSVYRKELAIRAAGEDPEAMRREVEERLETPALAIVATDSGSEAGFAYDAQVHGLIGMGLFFASFTIMFMVNNLLEERRLGVWDRVIQSATPRQAMYGGHLAFSFVTGLAQIVIVFSLFDFVFNVDLGQDRPAVFVIISAYTLAIVALGLFLAGLVRNAQQMNVVIPLVAVSSAMLGGAYWPLEIVNNQLLLTLSRFTPIRYALDALKGVVYHDHGWSQLAGPIGALLAFAVVFVALGLWLIDRRAS